MVAKIDSVQAADSSGATETQRKRLLDSCREFEAVLTGQMLKSMRASVLRADEPDSAQSLYEEMMDTQLAKDLSQRGDMGIGSMLFEKLAPLVKSAGNSGAEGAEGAEK